MKNNFTCASILAKMAWQLNPSKARYQVEHFKGWLNKNLCHVYTVNAIKRRNNPTDKIVLVGSRFNTSNDGTYVHHSFLIDSNNDIVADSNSSDPDSIYYYEPGKGYFCDDVLVAAPLEVIPVREFFKLMFSDSEHIQVSEFREDYWKNYPHKKNKKEEAAVDPVQLDNFIYLMYLILKLVTSGKVEKGEAVSKIDLYFPNAAKFLTKYKVGYRLFAKLLKAIQDGKKFDNSLNEIVNQFGKDLKVALKPWVSDSSISQIQLNMLKAFGTYFRKRDSTNARDFLFKNVNKTKHASLVRLFSDVDSLGSKTAEILNSAKKSQNTSLKQIRDLTKKMIGTSVDKMTIDQSKAAKEKYPEEYKMYLALRRSILGTAKDFLRLTLRKSGQELISYKKFLELLKTEGLIHAFPEGFDGYLDEEGNFYTLGKKRIAGNPSTKVTMNPNYDPKTDNTFVFTVISPTDTTQDGGYFYTLDFKRQKTSEKFSKVEILGKALNSLRKKWLVDISAKDRDGICAAEVELIYYFAARIGTLGNKAHGEPTYGMSTLLVKHVKKVGKNYVFQYPGKKGTVQHHILEPNVISYKKIAPILDSMMHGKKPSDPLWTWKNEWIPTSAVSRYWKSLAPITSQVGVHKIRTAEGTAMAKELMENCPFKKGDPKTTQSAVEKWYKEEMKKVGTKLQHRSGEKETGMTAIKSYVDLDTQKKFFDDLGLRIPAFLKFSKDE